MNAPWSSALSTALEQFVRTPKVLVATDFDGVLAPLVLDPRSSSPQAGTIEALRELAALPDTFVAVVSGRDLATLSTLTGLSGKEGVVLIGSHGGESSEPLTTGSAIPANGLGDAEQAALEAATRALDTIISRYRAARIEHKPAGVVLHTRGMEPGEAEAASSAALAIPDAVPGLHAMRGKSVVELSVLDVTKGSALAALANKVDAPVTVYFGDDVTDETVFTALDAAAGHVTVKVGDGPSAASHRIDSCEAMPALLSFVLQTRRDR